MYIDVYCSNDITLRLLSEEFEFDSSMVASWFMRNFQAQNWTEGLYKVLKSVIFNLPRTFYFFNHTLGNCNSLFPIFLAQGLVFLMAILSEMSPWSNFLPSSVIYVTSYRRNFRAFSA